MLIVRGTFASLIALCAIAINPELHAQSPDPSGPSSSGYMICLPIGHLWRGSADEIRRIENDPVPQSYREIFFATGCNYLIPTSLFDWHLQYGTAETIAPAFAFFEENYQSEFPRVSNLQRAFEREFRHDADHDHDRALQELRLDWERSKLLAHQYIRAAEFFSSSELLARSEPHLERIAEALPVLYPAAEDQLSRQRRSIEEQEYDSVLDMQWRFAILQARLSGSVSDINNAIELLEARYVPTYPAALQGYTGGHHLCDVGRLSEWQEEAFEDMCREEGFELRALSFWRHYASIQAIIEGVSGDRSGIRSFQMPYGELPPPPPSQQGATSPGNSAPRTRYFSPHRDGIPNLFKRLIYYGRNFGGYYHHLHGEDNLISLYLERADSNLSRIGQFPEENLAHNAMQDLLAAARLAPPFERPGRFRQIARRFIILNDEADRTPETRRILGRLSPIAAYFRMNLENMNQVILAEPTNAER